LEITLDQLRYRISMRIPLTEPHEARVRIMTHFGAKSLEADLTSMTIAELQALDEPVPGLKIGGTRKKAELS